MAGIWIFTDTHLGARNNNNEWVSIIETAHYDFIMPTIEKNWKDGDIIIHCGDVFDNRQSINLKVLDLGIKIYERLAKLGHIHIIAGNHDIYKKDSTEITSLDILKWIPNVCIWKEPKILTLGKHKLFLMPWRKDTKEESRTLIEYQKEHEPHYAFMHGTFNGTQYNKYVKIEGEDGGSTGATRGYKRVYSGHIHWAQHINNINIVGCPYEITRGDSDNKKGLYYLDLETGEETFYENTVSPKHIKFRIDEFNKDIFKRIKESSRNNFIDIQIANSVIAENGSKILKEINEIKELARNVEILQYEDAIVAEGTEEGDGETLEQRDLINIEVEKRIKEDDRKRALKIIDDIIKEVI